MKNKIIAGCLSVFMSVSHVTSFASLTTPNHSNDPSLHNKERSEKSTLCTQTGNNAAVIRLLLNAGAGSEKERELTHKRKERDEILEKTLKEKNKKEDLDAHLLKAVCKGNSKEVAQLLHAGATKDIQDRCGRTLLHIAAERGHEPIVALLIGAGANKEARTVDGLTPLHKATGNADIAIIEMLLKAGIKTNAQDTDGLTPLHYAAQDGHTAIVEVLLKAGVYKDIPDQNNYTPLHWAALNNRETIVDLLIKAGSHKEAVSKNGATPLHLAAFRGCKGVVALLLRAGAHFDCSDSAGKTPLASALAAEFRNFQLIHLLLLMDVDKGGGTLSEKTQALLQQWEFDTFNFVINFERSKTLVEQHEHCKELHKLLNDYCRIPTVLVNIIREYHTWSPDILIPLFIQASATPYSL